MDTNWILKYDTLETGKRSYAQESLMTLGNGYLGWRGAPVWSEFSEDHYPGLYVAGVFNRTKTRIAGRDIVNEDIVNLPNPQLMRFYVNGTHVIFDESTIVARESWVNFWDGTQTDLYTLRLNEGLVIFESTKYVDPINFHQFGFRLKIKAGFNATLRIESFIDGTVRNQNVERYRAFDNKEFEVLSVGNHLLKAKTRTTNIDIIVAAKTFISGEAFVEADSESTEKLLDVAEIEMQANESINVDKVIGVATSYETENPESLVQSIIEDLLLDNMKENSVTYWAKVWETADIVLESENEDLQRMIRLNIFHIHQAAQHHANKYLNASVGSRGLTGEGYRGHIFWDEIFVIPYYAANEPETARDVLHYRMKRLKAAQENAKINGEKGAMYPWQSGIDGDEQSQLIHLNTVDNKWEPDNSRLQRHVSLAIAYNLWIYVQLTADVSILNDGGLDVLFEISKFWLNKAKLGADGRYHITGVMGPDEYHEAYPGAAEAGVCDNAYTNLMLAWLLNWLLELPCIKGLDLKKAARKAKFDNKMAAKARAVSRNLALMINDRGVIAQYTGYFELKEVDFKAYKRKYGDIHRIDRLLKAEGLSPDEYQVAKQADMLMTIYNLGVTRTQQLVERLGYTLPKDWLRVNRDYYLERTVHGSTTSRPVFAGIDVTMRESDNALDFLIDAIGSDYYDIQGGTTAEGIHIGVMGETLEVIQNEFAGVTLRDGKFLLTPRLPKSWNRIKFTQKFQDALVKLDISQKLIVISADKNVKMCVYDKEIQLMAGGMQTFATRSFEA